MGTDEPDITPPEVREVVDHALELIHRRARARRVSIQPSSSEEIQRRLRLIRRRVEARRRNEER